MRGNEIRGGQMLDTYNQQIQTEVSCTIRTNINTANHHFIVEEWSSKEEKYTPTKVSIGTPQNNSSEESWGGGIARCVKTDDSLATMVRDENRQNNMLKQQSPHCVYEPQIIEVGRVNEGKHQQDFVQHEDGICRCICTGHHASTPHLLKTMVSEPNVLTPKRTEFGKTI